MRRRATTCEDRQGWLHPSARRRCTPPGTGGLPMSWHRPSTGPGPDCRTRFERIIEEVRAGGAIRAHGDLPAASDARRTSAEMVSLRFVWPGFPSPLGFLRFPSSGLGKLLPSRTDKRQIDAAQRWDRR